MEDGKIVHQKKMDLQEDQEEEQDIIQEQQVEQEILRQ